MLILRSAVLRSLPTLVNGITAVLIIGLLAS
jgi:hypothetical protein